ncbi:hypothetical protein N0V93_003270 [Gnomoniopsis smithogilvyi]|uniref:Uncharacterized protein n=1 Tax=Gnomoniopsis smithogilvyi TaxID=1191159 RepID=A0A9W8YYZ7_9PEZI|nr:hypothetical protein N0V93_003270 [Gnomoniopsis smithogilvyi]
MPDLSSARLSEVKTPSQKETRRLDRDALPSMQKAATAHESSNLKMVSYAAEDGNESEGSSICHSPTWDDYGKKKRKDAEPKRKRLTKEPPPAAMDNRPVLSSRAMTDSTLSIQQLRQCLESGNSSQQLTSAPSETSIPLPVESIDTVSRSPGFIGGVRLEREREAAMKKLMNSRASSIERPASEMMLQSPPLQSQSKLELAKKRETAPAVSYPPKSSKTPFLADPRPPRTRRNSIGQGLKLAAGKLFSSKDKDSRNGQPSDKRNDSRASVETVQTLYGTSENRGRQMDGSSTAHSRHQSFDSHQRDDSQKDERRGAVSMPPVAWKNKNKQLRTISMMAVPPDSARDGSFSPFHSPQLDQDDFGFLERPFSPPTAPPMSPPASMSPSLKAKISPTFTPTPVASPASQPSSKKTFRETLKAGFRSSSSTPDAKPARRRSGTLDTLVGTETEISSPVRDGYALQNPPTAPAAGSPASSARGGRQTDEHGTGQSQSATDLKDSGASSSSSHHGSESQAPSPMTTPEGSRPQSSKDNQALRLDEVKRIPPLSYENVIAMRGSPTLPAAGYCVPKKTHSPRASAELPKGSPKSTAGQHGRSGSKFAEDLSPIKSFLTDELWSQTRKPLDPDQLSFTSALTSIDVKRSFVDLNSALQSSNEDVTPLSLEPASKTGSTVQKETTPSSTGFHFDLSPKGSHTSLPPPSPHSARSPWVNGRPIPGQAPLPANKLDKEPLPSQARLDSPDLRSHPRRKASDYLEEARKAAPASPRAPPSSTNSQSSLPITNNVVSAPRSFALSKPQTAAVASSTAAVFSPLTSHPVKRSSKQESTPLGTPISKMLVECCHCKFYQDMPSRVYEAMARPDDIVKDKKLGVSGQVTTCVKCPWCAHNMSTVCCAGYAAIVYLQEKLHGP